MDFTRHLEPLVLDDLVPKKVNLIFGARRVGKTFVIRQILGKTTYPTLYLDIYYGIVLTHPVTRSLP